MACGRAAGRAGNRARDPQCTAGNPGTADQRLLPPIAYGGPRRGRDSLRPPQRERTIGSVRHGGWSGTGGAKAAAVNARWAHAAANRLVLGGWRRICAAGTITAGTRAARRFAAFGEGTGMAFPQGTLLGERWIAIGHFTLIGPYVTISAGFVPERDLGPDPIVRIGSGVVLGRGSHVVGHQSIEIGDDVYTGPNVYITDQNHGYTDPDVAIGKQWPVNDPVRIGAGCWLGTGSVILPGASIGRNVVVAAGAVCAARCRTTASWPAPRPASSVSPASRRPLGPAAAAEPHRRSVRLDRPAGRVVAASPRLRHSRDPRHIRQIPGPAKLPVSRVLAMRGILVRRPGPEATVEVRDDLAVRPVGPRDVRIRVAPAGSAIPTCPPWPAPCRTSGPPSGWATKARANWPRSAPRCRRRPTRSAAG